MVVATAKSVDNIRKWNIKFSVGENEMEARISTKQSLKKMVAILECSRCSERYDDIRVPRILACGHSICKVCLQDYPTFTIWCPDCFQEQPIMDPNIFPSNHQLLRIARNTHVKEVQINCNSTSILAEMFDHSQYKNVWSCTIHGSTMCLLCYTCKMWVCHDCVVINHPCPPRGACRVLRYADAMETVRNSYEKSAKETFKEIESMKKNFENEIFMHEFCLQHCSKERSHLRLLECAESKLEGNRENHYSVVKKTREDLEELRKLALETTSPEELMSYIKALGDFQEKLKETILQEKDRLSEAMPSMLEHLRMDLKSVVEGKQPVYAVRNEDEKSRYSLVTIKDQRLLVCSLQEEEPPEDCITIPYGFIKRLVPESWITVFMDVGTTEESSGRVYIVMPERLQWYRLSQQMLLMCTGEKGVTYKGSIFHEYQEDVKMLHGGDYENNDGTGGRPIVERLSSGRALRYFNAMHGIVQGDRKSTRFSFFLGYAFKRIFYEGIGRVYEGLKTLETVAKMKPLTMVLIRECGVVIPMQPYGDKYYRT